MSSFPSTSLQHLTMVQPTSTRTCIAHAVGQDDDHSGAAQAAAEGLQGESLAVVTRGVLPYRGMMGRCRDRC